MAFTTRAEEEGRGWDARPPPHLAGDRSPADSTLRYGVLSLCVVRRETISRLGLEKEMDTAPYVAFGGPWDSFFSYPGTSWE